MMDDEGKKAVVYSLLNELSSSYPHQIEHFTHESLPLDVVNRVQLKEHNLMEIIYEMEKKGLIKVYTKGEDEEPMNYFRKCIDNNLICDYSVVMRPKGFSTLNDLNVEKAVNLLEATNKEIIDSQINDMKKVFQDEMEKVEATLNKHENEIGNYYVKIIEIFGVFVALFSFIIVSINLYNNVPIQNIDVAVLLIVSTILSLTLVIVILLLSIRFIIIGKPPQK